MSMTEPDGVGDDLRNQLRVALTVAGRLAEVAARQHEQQLRDAQADSQQRARELQNRLDGERAGARAALAPVQRPDWWDRADPREIAEAWQTASAWRDVDPDAERAAVRIRSELRDRYDLDVSDLRADPTAVKDALERRERALRDAAGEQDRGGAELAEAQLLGHDSAGVDELDDARQQDLGGELYDSAKRRENLAASLDGVADQEAVQARVLADTHQARPAQEAVADTPARGPRARRARPGPERSQQRTRGR